MPTPIDTLSVRIEADTAPFAAALQGLGRQAESFSGAITRAFRDAVVGGRDFGAVLESLALRISSLALTQALTPVSQGLTSLFGRLAGGLGGLLAPVPLAPAVRPFAAGGVIAAPTYFPLAGGLGLAGEAGPEAVLPLARGGDGRLGVRSAGGPGTISVTVNVTTPDVESFRKSEAEVTAMLARAVLRGHRAL